MNKEAIIEGLLFVAGDDGLSSKEIAQTLEIDEKEVKEEIKNLEIEYNKESHGITMETFGGRYKLVTKKEHKIYYEKFFESEKEETLSTACLEVLAIIAYNTPVTRSMVDEIRGVSSSHIIRKLLSKNMIEVKGKAELPGRPNLYGITPRFLDYFGLSSIEELPKIDIVENEDEMNLYESKYKENTIEILDDI